MNLRRSQLDGRLRLRHLKERHEAVSEEMDVQRHRFAALAGDTSKPLVVSSFNLFQTPELLAARMVSMFSGKLGRVLEPSAGLGRIYRALRAHDPDAEIVLVEQSAECCQALYGEIEGDGNARLIQADFFECDESRTGLFDTIAMNPPFKMGIDIRHIKHALKKLKPGGRLISLCANGPKQRAQLKPLADEWIELPEDTFKAEATRVNAAIMVINK